MGYLDIIEVKKRIEKIGKWDRENIFIKYGTFTNEKYSIYNKIFSDFFNTLKNAKKLNQYSTMFGLIKYLKDNTPSENYKLNGLKESKDFLELINCFVNIIDNGFITDNIYELENIDLETITEMYIKKVSLIYLRKLKIEKIIKRK